MHKLNPANIGIYNNGEKLPLPQRLQLIKNGVRGISNAVIDPVFTKHSDQLPKEFREGGELHDKILSTTTFLAKSMDGQVFGEAVDVSANGYSLKFIVNKVFRELILCGLAANLTQDNFNLEMASGGKRAIIEIKEEALRVIRFSTNEGDIEPKITVAEYGLASESTLWIPAEEGAGGKHSEKRRLAEMYIVPRLDLLSRRVSYENCITITPPSFGPSFSRMMLVENI